jgi:predicted RNA binding protein YcfA (HicA-like mRNA interferase family)
VGLRVSKNRPGEQMRSQDDESQDDESLDKPKRLAYARPTIKVRALLKTLSDDGWVLVRQRGSHRQLQHPTKPGTLTVPGHPSDTLPTGTCRSVIARAKLEDRR